MAVDSDGARTSSSDKNAGDWRVKGGFIPMEKSNGCMRYARREYMLHMTNANTNAERKRGI